MAASRCRSAAGTGAARLAASMEVLSTHSHWQAAFSRRCRSALSGAPGMGARATFAPWWAIGRPASRARPAAPGLPARCRWQAPRASGAPSLWGRARSGCAADPAQRSGRWPPGPRTGPAGWPTARRATCAAGARPDQIPGGVGERLAGLPARPVPGARGDRHVAGHLAGCGGHVLEVTAHDSDQPQQATRDFLNIPTRRRGALPGPGM